MPELAATARSLTGWVDQLTRTALINAHADDAVYRVDTPWAGTPYGELDRAFHVMLPPVRITVWRPSPTDPKGWVMQSSEVRATADFPAVDAAVQTLLAGIAELSEELRTAGRADQS